MSELNGVYKALPSEVLAILGASRLGYIKAVESGKLASYIPGAPALPSGSLVFVLHAADGTPVSVTPSRESAMASAAEHHIDAVSVH